MKGIYSTTYQNKQPQQYEMDLTLNYITTWWQSDVVAKYFATGSSNFATGILGLDSPAGFKYRGPIL